MVDEFQNEQQEQETNVGDRVRESVAELCGALDELIEEEDAISNGRASVPSLREQLVDSWQGKSYYERLQNVVDADAVRTSLFFPLDWGGVLFRSRMLAAASSVPKILTHPPTHPRTSSGTTKEGVVVVRGLEKIAEETTSVVHQPEQRQLYRRRGTCHVIVAVSELAVEFRTSLVRSRCSPAAASSSPAAAAATEEEKAVDHLAAPAAVQEPGLYDPAEGA